MAGKPVSQKVEELAERVGAHIPTAEYRLSGLQEGMGELREQVRELETLAQQVPELRERLRKLEELPAQVARVEERVKPLEKRDDRQWQVWLAIIGAALAIVVTFVKK